MSVSPGSLTFTKTGEAQDAGKYQWSDPQTVTLTSVSDSDAEDEIEAVSHKMTIDKKDYVLDRVRAIIRDSALPGLTYTPDTVSVPEGGTADYTVALVSDPGDGVTIVVNVAVSLISTTGNAITVSPSSLTFTGGPSGYWETPQTVTVTCLVDDDQFEDLAKITHTTVRDGITYNWPKVTVSVSDGNRAPFFEDGLKTTRSIDENSDEGAAVGAPVVATDLKNDILTYEIEVTESGPYTVDSTTGQIRLRVGVSLDHENKTTQEVKLAVKDPSGLSDAIEVAIEIANVNEPPTVSGTGTLSYPENTATTRVLHRYTATDPESGSITWSVMGADGSAFTIDSSGNLKFSSQPDHETQDEYSITIIATDDGDPSAKGEFTVTVEVSDVNEAPEVQGRGSETYQENNIHPVVPYAAVDPEGATSFTWSLGGTDSSDFEISTTGVLNFKNIPDFERPSDSGGKNVYNVIVRASDGSLTGTKDVTVTVNDVNEPPIISGEDTLSYPENTATTGTLDRYTATDPERGQITWSIEGTDADDFRIDSSGNLALDPSPDYEMPNDSGVNDVYDVSVVASDGDLTLSYDVTVTAIPIDEPPVITGNTTIDSYDENTSATNTVATYTAEDSEGDTPITWSLVVQQL